LGVFIKSQRKKKGRHYRRLAPSRRDSVKTHVAAKKPMRSGGGFTASLHNADITVRLPFSA
jgi:hypothetical protein